MSRFQPTRPKMVPMTASDWFSFELWKDGQRKIQDRERNFDRALLASSKHLSISQVVSRHKASWAIATRAAPTPTPEQ
jgi:hypothetical protein